MRDIFGEDLTADQAVDRILREVKASGDQAVRDYNSRIDGYELEELEISKNEIKNAYQKVDPSLVEALRFAAQRVRSFHEKQRRNSWIDFSEGGLGQLILPLERVGVYAPGGTAAYPSTVIMTVVPAKVAGVSEVYLLTPPRGPEGVSPLMMVAADIAGVDRVFQAGGAQAIAAMAFGTETIPKVDKIFGPGNIFVVLAKRRVFGSVGIDSLPGPTETLLIADDSANPVYCAADLLAQSEHDPMASAILLTSSGRLATKVSEEIERQLDKAERKTTILESLSNNGGIVITASIDEAIRMANEYGPEHLCLLLHDPWSALPKIRNAGGVFVGEMSSETLGDYIAGPSHVMPTGGSSRYSSPLNLDDFVKITSVIALDEKAIKTLGPTAVKLARAEGLTSHADAAEIRLFDGQVTRK